MQRVKQLSVFLKNRPGTLADICEQLSAQGVNILGFSVSDTVDHAVIRMVVDEPRKACHFLGDAGLLVVENEIIQVELKNEPGELARFSKRLAQENVNIEYAYGGLSRDAGVGVLFVRVSDVGRALELN